LFYFFVTIFYLTSLVAWAQPSSPLPSAPGSMDQTTKAFSKARSKKHPKKKLPLKKDAQGNIIDPNKARSLGDKQKDFNKDSDIKKEPQTRTALEDAMINADIALSDRIDAIADSIDLFLARKRTVEIHKKNPTTVRINNSTYSSEGAGLKNNWGLNVGLRLPNLEKSWALRFTTYDENTEERGVRRNTLRETPRPENYGTSLALFRQLGSIKTTFRPRIELRNPLRVSHMLRFEATAEENKFLIRPKVELFATPSKGTGVFTGLNFEYDLNKYFSLSQFNESEYEEGRNLFSVDNGFTLGQIISEEISVVYTFLFESSSRPSYHLDQYVFATSWRESLYKRVVEFTVTPNISFPRSLAYKGHVGANLGISLIF
jgi:hypothetical protein